MSFLGEFVGYLKTRTDAPPDFHLHAGMVALAVALGNRVWCDGWARSIYPNLWVVIIAPSGFGKSVPLDMSQSVARDAGMDDAILPDSFSQEALYDALKKQSVGVFYLQEFASFLGVLNREYNAGSMSWLTSVFDVPAVDRRMLRGQTIELHKPCISILGASSPDWFADSFKQSMLRGGFLARFLFCPSKEPGPYVGHPGPRDERLETILAGHLQDVQQLDGKADLSQVWERFNEWDRSARQRLRDGCPPEFSGMRSRAGLQVLKASMLFHVSRDPRNLSIELQDLENAIRYVERCQRLAEAYLSNDVAHDRDDADTLRVREVMQRSGGRIERSEVMKNAHLGARRLDAAERTLKESGRLVVRRESRTVWYYSPEAVDISNSQRAANSCE